MAKHNQPLWYFIDFENTNTIGNIVPKENDRIFLFIGAMQKQLNVLFVKELTDMPCKVELIAVQGQSPNNVDFHLSCYLGLHHGTTPKNINFIVVSNDKGYNNLIAHLNSQGRNCTKIART